MTITTTTKSNDTREQLRRLMSRHAATTVARPAPVVEKPKVVARPPVQIEPRQSVAKVVAAPAPKADAPAGKAAGGDRCTLRLSAAELTKIDRLILDAHQRVGERITVSDVLRIGLARITQASLVASAEIGALRASDGRRTNKPH